MLQFVPAAEIDPMLYDRSYYLEPDSTSTKSYVLLARTLDETDRVAIAAFALRNKTRLAVLRVRDLGKRPVMVVQTLLWPDEIRDPDFPALDTPAEIKPAELTIAAQLVESMVDDFEPQRFRDDYQDQLHDLVEAKLQGEQAFSAESPDTAPEAPEDVSDLLAKLEASIQARKAGGN